MAAAPLPRKTLESGFQLLLVVAVTVAFAWLIGPFAGAVLWGVIAALLFTPLNNRLLRAMPGRPNTVAAITLTAIFLLVIIPALLLGAALISEASAVYNKIQSGNIDLNRSFEEGARALPAFARNWLNDIGLTDFAALQQKISDAFNSSFRVLAGQAVTFGQSALSFFLALGVMLYLTYFLLRDGYDLVDRIEQRLPMPSGQRRLLFHRFVAVVRATIKGTLIVAVLQGLIGGFIFWVLGIEGALLWGVAMGIFSLFPAVGTGLIWVPMTIYLLATGQLWQGGVLFACGFFIISSVDNVVRPILVGRDTRIPDYLVLISTLGGFELMGFNGFVMGPVIAALFMAVWDIYSHGPESAVTAAAPAAEKKAAAPKSSKPKAPPRRTRPRTTPRQS
ncbi:MAG: AI-2E family transporter [Sphingomonadales bacterium]